MKAKRNWMRLTPVMVISILLGTSCKHEPTLSADTLTVCFQEQVLPLIKSNCAISGCHAAASHEEGPVLDSYDNIMNVVEPFKPNKSKLYEVITKNQGSEEFMPPSPRSPLTAEQISTISIWILQGAENNSCPEPPCDTLNVTFSESIWPVVNTWCLGCHSGGNPEAGLRLENYDQVAAIANDGRFFGTVNHDPGYVGMPFESPKLSDCTIATIRIWIENGAPNN